jgi:hypothetical protein
MLLYPLAFPGLAAAAGALAGYFTFRSQRFGGLWILSMLIFSAIAMAIVPNARQQFYDLGISLPAIDVLSNISYVVFAFSFVGAWMLQKITWRRWLLATLIPLSFAQPLLWTFAFFAWSTRGFAP